MIIFITWASTTLKHKYQIKKEHHRTLAILERKKENHKTVKER